MSHIHKQNISKGCFVCGVKNDHSLKANFYYIKEDTLVAKFRTQNEHQSYPGILHGGIAAAILDETMGRAIMRNGDDIWGVTIDLNLKYRKSLPTESDLYVRARLTEDKSRFFRAEGEIFLPDGNIAVTGSGKFMKMPLDKITTDGDFLDDWFYVEDETELQLPDFVLKD